MLHKFQKVSHELDTKRAVETAVFRDEFGNEHHVILHFAIDKCPCCGKVRGKKDVPADPERDIQQALGELSDALESRKQYVADRAAAGVKIIGAIPDCKDCK